MTKWQKAVLMAAGYFFGAAILVASLPSKLYTCADSGGPTTPDGNCNGGI